MCQQVIRSNVFDGGAEAFVDVGEEEVVADLFDLEVDGVADQELITTFDGEVFDGVGDFEEQEVSP